MTNYCPKCGAYIPQMAKKCLACGAGDEEQEDLKFPPPVIYGTPKTPRKIQRRIGRESEEPEEIPAYPLDSRVLGTALAGRDMSGRLRRNPIVAVDGNTAEAWKRWADKDKPVDLDLDKARSGYINVRINGEVSRFYFTTVEMTCRYVAGDNEKRVFSLQIVEV